MILLLGLCSIPCLLMIHWIPLDLFGPIAQEAEHLIPATEFYYYLDLTQNLK